MFNVAPRANDALTSNIVRGRQTFNNLHVVVDVDYLHI